MMELGRPEKFGDSAKLGNRAGEGDADRRQAAARGGPAGRRRRASHQPCDATTILLVPRREMPSNGLEVASDCHAVRGVRVRLPRFLCAGRGRTETRLNWPSHCRSTPELDQPQARLTALMSFRVPPKYSYMCRRSTPGSAPRHCAAIRRGSASSSAMRQRISRPPRQRRSPSAWIRPSSETAKQANAT